MITKELKFGKGGDVTINQNLAVWSANYEFWERKGLLGENGKVWSVLFWSEGNFT